MFKFYYSNSEVFHPPPVPSLSNIINKNNRHINRIKGRPPAILPSLVKEGAIADWMEEGLRFRFTSMMMNQHRSEEGLPILGRSAIMNHFDKIPILFLIWRCGQITFFIFLVLKWIFHILVVHGLADICSGGDFLWHYWLSSTCCEFEGTTCRNHCLWRWACHLG